MIVKVLLFVAFNTRRFVCFASTTSYCSCCTNLTGRFITIFQEISSLVTGALTLPPTIGHDSLRNESNRNEHLRFDFFCIGDQQWNER